MSGFLIRDDYTGKFLHKGTRINARDRWVNLNDRRYPPTRYMRAADAESEAEMNSEGYHSVVKDVK